MQIVIYGTPTCSVCKQAREWLDEQGTAYTYEDLTEMPRHRAQAIIEYSQMKTVPIIYDGGHLIGGFDKLKPYVQGELF